jgi:hypothetical protein
MRTAIACGVLVVLVSCGGNGPDIDTTQDNVCDQVAEVACFDIYQCCSEGEIESTLGVSDPRTQAECQTDLATRCRRTAADLEFSAKNKHVKFDSKLMNDCLKEFVAPSNTCVTVEAIKPWVMACKTSPWTGIVAVGGACDFAYECAKDSFCAPNRTCTALPTENMPCTVQGCASGLFCDAAATGGPMCHPLLAAGTACTSTTQCQKDLVCDTAAPAGMRTCTALHANGDVCDANFVCSSNFCLPGTCATSGDSCTNDTACGGQCSNSPTVFCSADNQCGTGTCSGTATLCLFPTDCTASGSTCVFTNKCNLEKCMGNVCADAHVTIDYCQGARTELPLLGSGQIVVGGGG